MTITNL